MIEKTITTIDFERVCEIKNGNNPRYTVVQQDVFVCMDEGVAEMVMFVRDNETNEYFSIGYAYYESSDELADIYAAYALRPVNAVEKTVLVFEEEE